MQKAYTPEEMKDASNFINILDSVAPEKREVFRFMMECILLGANMAQMGTARKE